MTETTSNPATVAESVADVQAAVQDAVRSGVPLVDYGLAHGGLGNPPPEEHTRLSLRGGVIEHHVDDMTVRVHAGCPVGDLQRTLGESGQFLPLDADDDISISEAIAHNVFGPLRVSYGSLRDLLLGLAYVDGEGRHIQVGGRTVKNVAGYDVSRFMIGSLNELGVITEATLRTYAVPDNTLGVDLALETAQHIDGLITEWLTADARPAWLAMNRGAEGFVLRLAYFGPVAACMTQLRSLETLVERWHGIRISGTGEDRFDRDRLRRATRGEWKRVVPALVRVVVPPDQTGYACQVLAQHPVVDPSRQIEACPVTGRLFIGGPLNPDATRRLEEQVQTVIDTAGGFRVWHQRPPGAEDVAPVKPLPEDYDTLTELKRTTDPRGIFNPGRFLSTPHSE